MDKKLRNFYPLIIEILCRMGFEHLNTNMLLGFPDLFTFDVSGWRVTAPINAALEPSRITTSEMLDEAAALLPAFSSELLKRVQEGSLPQGIEISDERLQNSSRCVLRLEADVPWKIITMKNGKGTITSIHNPSHSIHSLLSTSESLLAIATPDGSVGHALAVRRDVNGFGTYFESWLAVDDGNFVDAGAKAYFDLKSGDLTALKLGILKLLGGRFAYLSNPSQPCHLLTSGGHEVFVSVPKGIRPTARSGNINFKVFPAFSSESFPLPDWIRAVFLKDSSPATVAD